MTRPLTIIGIGQTPVGEHWHLGLRELAWQAARSLVGARPDALFVGNMLAGVLSGQEHLGALLADSFGLNPIEAITVEAAQASGGAAFHQACIAIRSGFIDTALVVGVEKHTDQVGAAAISAAGYGLDGDWETSNGVTAAGAAALLTRRYLHEYHLPPESLADFAREAHARAVHNPFAMFRNPLTATKSSPLATPIRALDGAPDADGAAALLLTACPERFPDARPLATVEACALTTDTLAIHDRANPLLLFAAQQGAQQVYHRAGITAHDIDFFELHDSFPIYAALSMEAAGFAIPGRGWDRGEGGEGAPEKKVPVCTMGGSKARGNPAGAVGVYQLVEAILQIAGLAGANQVVGARRVLVQCLGGSGATAVTTILTTV